MGTQLPKIEQIKQEKARRYFKDFIQYTMPQYEFNWHHLYLIEKLQDFAQGKIKRLMVFCPPRHGKSQLVSRHLPAWLLGLSPNNRIIACSYSADLASSMNRDVQRLMDDEKYISIFPATRLNSKNVVTTQGTLRNSTRFDVVNHSGYYVCAGVGGGITGLGADFAIIDDPVKNAEEANSLTIRERHWEWYTSTLYTRLEKGASVLITLTRWNQDDLAGRLVDLMEQTEDADQWEIIKFPAIKESNENPDDMRAIGEPLWINKYNLKRLQKIKSTVGSRVWNALYQQRPAPLEGGIFKKNWFRFYQTSEIDLERQTVNFYIDTAYTDKQENDATAILAFTKVKKDLYLINCEAVRLEFPELVKYIPSFCKKCGYTRKSRVWIEPKASGLSIIQELKRNTRLNVIQDKPPKESKVTRANAVSATVEAGRVFIPQNTHWTDTFLDEIITFPNGSHDDRVDCLIGAIKKTLIEKSKTPRFANRPEGGFPSVYY